MVGQGGQFFGIEYVCERWYVVGVWVVWCGWCEVVVFDDVYEVGGIGL